MAIYSEFSHEKRWCSIVMLVYQRVDCGNIGCVTHAHISMICHGYILENVATMVWRQILVPKNGIWSFIPCQIDQEKTNILVISGYDRVLCVCVPVCSVVFLCVPLPERWVNTPRLWRLPAAGPREFLFQIKVAQTEEPQCPIPRGCIPGSG